MGRKKKGTENSGLKAALLRYGKGKRNPKNLGIWYTYWDPQDILDCGTDMKMAGRLDMQALRFSFFNCLICREVFDSHRDHITHNGEAHPEYPFLCEICWQPVHCPARHQMNCNSALRRYPPPPPPPAAGGGGAAGGGAAVAGG